MLKRIDYLPHLEACWQEHLVPRAKDAPTVISTFAGGGGSSLGYSMAGFKELLAVEWDDNAVETFKLNFPDVPVYHGDIAKLSVDEVLERIGLKIGELDILDGSPPCQGFSTAGKRRLEDSRNGLYLEFSRLLRGLQPKVFVMENVSGMVKGKMKIVFAEILRDLKDAGYKVSVKLLNAMYFGVPQSRQRLIFIGIRNDLGIAPSHPEAETKPINAIRIDSKPSKYSHKRYGDVIIKNKPATTIAKLQRLFWDEGNEFGKLSYAVNGSFPSSFKFLSSHSDIKNRIGNSVPPLFMRSIALHIRKELLDE